MTTGSSDGVLRPFDRSMLPRCPCPADEASSRRRPLEMRERRVKEPPPVLPAADDAAVLGLLKLTTGDVGNDDDADCSTVVDIVSVVACGRRPKVIVHPPVTRLPRSVWTSKFRGQIRSPEAKNPGPDKYS